MKGEFFQLHGKVHQVTTQMYSIFMIFSSKQMISRICRQVVLSHHVYHLMQAVISGKSMGVLFQFISCSTYVQQTLKADAVREISGLSNASNPFVLFCRWFSSAYVLGAFAWQGNINYCLVVMKLFSSEVNYAYLFDISKYFQILLNSTF